MNANPASELLLVEKTCGGSGKISSIFSLNPLARQKNSLQ